MHNTNTNICRLITLMLPLERDLLTLSCHFFRLSVTFPMVAEFRASCPWLRTRQTGDPREPTLVPTLTASRHRRLVPRSTEAWFAHQYNRISFLRLLEDSTLCNDSDNLYTEASVRKCVFSCFNDLDSDRGYPRQNVC